MKITSLILNCDVYSRLIVIIIVELLLILFELITNHIHLKITWNKYIAINGTTRPDDTRPRPQCLEAEAEAIAIEAEASFFGFEAKAGLRT